MRLLFLIASLTFAGSVMAEKTPPSHVKEMDKSTPMIKGAAPANNDLHAEGVVHRDIATRDADPDDTEGPAKHNATRSNEPDTDDQGSSGGPRSSHSQDYNSSRSNNTNGEADSGDDEGTAGDESRCKVSEDCDSAADGSGEDIVLRKRPGR